MKNVWHYVKEGKSIGPVTLEELLHTIQGGQGLSTLVFGPGTSSWVPAQTVPEVINAMKLNQAPPLPIKPLTFEVLGHDQQIVKVILEPGESFIAESGAMMYHGPSVKMSCSVGTSQKDFAEQLVAVGTRALTGESFFLVEFTNTGTQREEVGLAAPYLGKMVALDMSALGGEMICQKDSFLCASRGLDIGVAFQSNLAVGLFGGEGFILQRLRGQGTAIIHAGGFLIEKDLAPGESLNVDTGCLVALAPTVHYDVEMVRDIKSVVFAGEGLFLTHLKGPGKVWLQSLPFSRLAGRILSGAVGRGKGREEGSVLGVLGSVMRGDRFNF